MFVLYLLIACAIHTNAHGKNEIRAVKDYVVGAELRKVPHERRIFDFKKNGVKIDVKVVPLATDESTKDEDNDLFPDFPVKDIGKCIIEFSLSCIRKRFVRFLETVSHLDEITLLGQDMKLVKRRVAHSDDRSMKNNTDISIERTVDDLFDSFVLRITLPRWNKRERNQIDVMMDETAVEGRKKGGGGGGKGGGKCKMMMMGMLMMVKMKLMGVAALKGMMFGGMALMMMLMQKLGKGGGGGPWQGGGGGGGGHYKEVVLLTKASGHGGGGGGHGDSYSAPPSSSYGAPSGGGGGGYGSSGGGGWGRSFYKRLMSHDKTIKAEPTDEFNHTPMIGEVALSAPDIDYPDYQDYQKPPLITTLNSAVSNWNATNYIGLHEYGGSDGSTNSMKNNSKIRPTMVIKGRSFENSPISVSNVTEKNIESVTSKSQLIADVVYPTYMDEWQATAEKINPSNNSSAGSEARIESRQADSHPNDIPLLRGI